MKVTSFTRNALAYRRQRRKLLAEGWRHIPEPVWEIVRGFRVGEVIEDAVVSADGLSLYVKLGPMPKGSPTPAT